MAISLVYRERKSKFVRLFDKTPINVRCPHFYELILSNGCPFDCSYCYLKLTFRGKKQPVLFCNNWENVLNQINTVPAGVFSTGELADSLAIVPPLLEPTLDYFESQQSRYLLLVTKSININCLLKRKPTPQVIVSFSVNAPEAFLKFERFTPHPYSRLEAAAKLKQSGWRIRIRLDPIILEIGLPAYKDVCKKIAELKPERVTIGTLRQYPSLHTFAKNAPRKGLLKANDGRLRYSETIRLKTYRQIAKWLGFQPALCKETEEVWNKLGWHFYGCNCTI